MQYVSDKYLNKLFNMSVLTGSRAFNVATKDSDWDIVLTTKEYNLFGLNDVRLHSKHKMKNILLNIAFTESRTFNIEGVDEIDGDILEYNEMTIWGPIERMVKFKSPTSNEIINLFIYPANFSSLILDKFKEVNNLMNFLHGAKLQNKPYRIEAFKQILKSVGITDLS